MEETITLSVSGAISESVTGKVLAEKSFVFPHYSIEIVAISYDCRCKCKVNGGYVLALDSESAVSTGTKIGAGETQCIWSGYCHASKGSVDTQVYLKILDNKNTAITVNSTNDAEYTSVAYIDITVKFVGLV